jgi:hypothetical protein
MPSKGLKCTFTFLARWAILANLTPVACSWEAARSLPTKGQSERYRREVAAAEADPNLPKPELPVSTKLQDLIDEVIPHSPTMTDYVARLQSKGVEVRPKITRTGLVQGLSYSLDGVAFQGAHLQGCSFPKLQARGISYERERDLPSLMAVARGEKLTVKIEAEIAPKVELDDLESEIIRVFVRKDPVKSESESSSYGMSM